MGTSYPRWPSPFPGLYSTSSELFILFVCILAILCSQLSLFVYVNTPEEAYSNRVQFILERV